jgi:signal transduction histidine kinase
LDNLAEGGEVRLRAVQANDSLRLEVADDGPGFTPEALQRAVEPFFTTRRQGTGLGLSLSAEIVKAHGWELILANRPEGGAVISVLIPAADLVVESSPGPAPAVETEPEG